MKSLSKSIEQTEHLIIPNIGYQKFTRNMIFTKAKILTINKWHPHNINANFNTYHFPYLTKINYLDSYNLPIRDIFEFTMYNKNFKWIMPPHKLLPNNFHYLSSNYIEYMSIYNYYNLIKQTTSEKKIGEWNEYVNFKRKEFFS
jgi:hypothetical protein